MDPAEAASDREMSQKVLQSVESLPEPQRQVTALYYIDGYSQEEIAGFLETPVTTVKSRLHAARKSLRRRLMSMVEEVLKSQAPGELFAKRLETVIATYLSKGPSENLMQSDWQQEQMRLTGEVLDAEKEGMRITEALSRSEKAKLREKAALQCGLRRDEQGREILKQLLHDRSARVRWYSLRWYAAAIHPENPGYWGVQARAEAVPDGIEAVLTLSEDENDKVRAVLACVLSAYAHLKHEGVRSTMKALLEDPVHSVQHTGAKFLGIRCSGCGKEFG